MSLGGDLLKTAFTEHCVKHFIGINPRNPQAALWGRGYYCLRFTDEEAGVHQRRRCILPRHTSSKHSHQGSTLSARITRVHAWPRHPPTLACSGTHWGCSLYRVPSTPTVIIRRSSPWSSLLFSTMAAMPAPQSWAARRDTAPHTSFTTMLSSQVLSKPSCCRIPLTCRRASRSLQGSTAGSQDLLFGGPGTCPTWFIDPILRCPSRREEKMIQTIAKLGVQRLKSSET